jgi:cytochrome P450
MTIADIEKPAQTEKSYWATENTEPYEFYDELRAEDDVVWDEEMGAWLATSAKAVRAIMMDDELFAHPYTSMRAGEGYKKLRVDNPRSFQFLNGDDHHNIHRWWLKDLLGPKWVAKYRDEIVIPTISGILDDLAGRDDFDLADDFAERIPITIFAKLMDLPDQSRETLETIKRLNDDIAFFADAANSLKLEGTPQEDALAKEKKAIESAAQLNDMLMPLVTGRRNSDADDFVSRLWQGGPSIFPDWNEVDTLDACRRLLFAGSDTTTLAIENALHMLLTDAALVQTLRDGGPVELAAFVEEAFRMNGSIQFRPRRVTGEVTIGKNTMVAGDMVIAVLQGANRDETVFACPHLVDLQRKNARNHFSFNLGNRSCPGANLARAELSEAISAVLDRFDVAELTGPEKPTYRGFLMRSFRPLNVHVSRA